jgi:hypothetical protein
MEDQPTDVLGTGSPDVPVWDPRPVSPSGSEPPSGSSLRSLWAALPRGGTVPSDDERLERGLAFSGTYVSDDGQVRIRRAPASFEYSGSRFTGSCAICARAGLLGSTGEPLPDVRAVVRFLAAHDHGDVD